MTRHDDRVTVRQIIDAARVLIEIAENRTFDDLTTDRVFCLAVERSLEIIGDASSRLSSHASSLAPEVAWENVIGMRHRVIHGYDSIEYEILWSTVVSDVPALLPQLEALLAVLPAGNLE